MLLVAILSAVMASWAIALVALPIILVVMMIVAIKMAFFD